MTSAASPQGRMTPVFRCVAAAASSKRLSSTEFCQAQGRSRRAILEVNRGKPRPIGPIVETDRHQSHCLGDA